MVEDVHFSDIYVVRPSIMIFNIVSGAYPFFGFRFLTEHVLWRLAKITFAIFNTLDLSICLMWWNSVCYFRFFFGTVWLYGDLLSAMTSVILERLSGMVIFVGNGSFIYIYDTIISIKVPSMLSVSWFRCLINPFFISMASFIVLTLGFYILEIC